MRMRHDKCGEAGVCSQSDQLDLCCAHNRQLPVVVPGDNGDVIRPNNIWRLIVRLRNEISSFSVKYTERTPYFQEISTKY